MPLTFQLTEKSKCFAGILEHVDHALTFMILTDNTQKIIHQSIVHTGTNSASANLVRANPLPDNHKPADYIRSYIDDVPDGEENNTGVYRMPIINPEELVGQTFGSTKDGTQIHIVEAIKDHQNHVDDSSANIQF